MSNKTVGYVALAVGLGIMVFMVVANRFGLAGAHFGPKRISGLAMGAIIALAGVIFASRQED